MEIQSERQRKRTYPSVQPWEPPDPCSQAASGGWLLHGGSCSGNLAGTSQLGSRRVFLSPLRSVRDKVCEREC